MKDSHLLDRAIRRVPDFPKPGILFYDITSVLTDPSAFRRCIDAMHERYDGSGFDAIAAIEARGFLFAAPFAAEHGIPLILIRKEGKLPGKRLREEFSLEYGSDVVEVQEEDVPAGGRILVVDDLLATGGTVRAAIDLLIRAGASACEVFAVIGLPFLGFRKTIGDTPIETLIDFGGE